VAQEKATVPEADQAPPPTPGETPQAGQQEGAKEEGRPAGEAGASEDRLKGLETQLQELEQRNSAKDIQHKDELERLRLDSAAETERRIGQAVQKTRTEQAAERRETKIADAKRRADQGEEGALDELTTLAREPHQQARQSEEAEKIRTDAETQGWLQGYTTSLNVRLEKTKPSDERRAELIKLYDTGKFQELEDEMAKDESVGGTEMAALEKRLAAIEGTNKEASEEEAAQEIRASAGAELGGGTPSGGKAYKEKTREERDALSDEERDAAVARQQGR